jgi:methyl-CpG-binding domain protein 4|tara:strand:- start:861 stop:1259 length:399 start_codon:yes stop_codon:yes gene_type:complete
MIREIIRPLLQEVYKEDPWKMMVCCILLNLTKRQQVDIVREELFKRYPTEYDMIEANEKELSELLKPLGLYNKRAKTLIKFSWGWINGFNDIKELYGVGQYARDSWDIFQNNNMNIKPDDKVLQEYLRVENG